MSVAPVRRAASSATLDPMVGAEVTRVLSALAGRDLTGRAVTVQELRRGARVCRVRAAGSAGGPAVIVKHLSLPRAHRSAQATLRWLPSLGLPAVAPALLAAVAPAGVERVWHIYEDVGDVTLQDCCADTHSVDAAVTMIAALHVRGAGHALLSECRSEGEDFGIHYFLTRVGDARRLLDALHGDGRGRSRERRRVQDGLRRHLDALLLDASRRIRLAREAGGTETMLHGDLWTTNVVVTCGGARPAVRLIDWDRAGAGPATYDLSTFLLRFPSHQRPSVLARYRETVRRSGWSLPPDRELNVLCDTAECARYADRVVECAIAALRDGAEWAHDVLAEVLRWFEALAPIIPEQGA